MRELMKEMHKRAVIAKSAVFFPLSCILSMLLGSAGGRSRSDFFFKDATLLTCVNTVEREG